MVIRIVLFILFYACTVRASTNITTCQTLSISGETYILQNNVSSVNTCFYITNTDITLNLNGHTITYGSSGDDYSYGVALPNSYDSAEFNNVYGNHSGIVINNGFIVQEGTYTGNAVYGGDAAKRHGIYSKGGTGKAIYNVDITVSDYNSDCVRTEYSSGETDISYSDFRDNTTVIQSRHQGSGAVIVLNHTGSFVFDNNTIHDSPQSGVRIDGQSGDYATIDINNNISTISTIFTNPYAISIGSYVDGGMIYNNNLYGESRGIHVQGSSLEIYSNTINLTQTQSEPDYSTNIWTHGIKLEGLSGVYPSGVRIHNNNITVENEDNSGAYGISVSLEGDMSDNRIYDNTVTANFDESKTGNQQYSYAVGFIMDFDPPPSWSAEFSGNTFNAEYGQLYVYWDGFQDMVFQGSTFNQIDTYAGYRLITFDNGDVNDATGLYLCNATISGESTVTYTIQGTGLINEWFLDNQRHYWESPSGPEQITTVEHDYCTIGNTGSTQAGTGSFTTGTGSLTTQ